jgi:hypothetical protein
MDSIKSVTSSVKSSVKSCSSECSMVLAYVLVFLMLPIDSLLNVNVQSQVKSTLAQVLSNDIAKVFLAGLFYVIWLTNDTMLLLLYLCLLKKIGLY